MSRLLLDTSAYSAFMRGHEEAKAALQRAEEIVMTPIVLGELKAGFLCGKYLKKNTAELAAFLVSPRVVVVPLDAATPERYAAIVAALRRAGTPIPTNDLWIAASAMQHGLKILTADAHFSKVPQILVQLLAQE